MHTPDRSSDVFDSPVPATPVLKSPPRSNLKDASRLGLSTVFAEENLSPNETAYVYRAADESSTQSSFGDTPEFPSPAHNTPFYRRAPGASFGDDSFDTTIAKRHANMTGLHGALDDSDLPPTPVCAELPKSVKILRHRTHLDIGQHTPVMLQLSSSSDRSSDFSLGSTPVLSSPPASVALLMAGQKAPPPKDASPVAEMTPPSVDLATQSDQFNNSSNEYEHNDSVQTPVGRNQAVVVPDSAFDPKYQRGFEDDVLGVSGGGRDEESWLVDVPESEPATPATPMNHKMEEPEEEAVVVVVVKEKAGQIEPLQTSIVSKAPSPTQKSSIEAAVAVTQEEEKPVIKPEVEKASIAAPASATETAPVSPKQTKEEPGQDKAKEEDEKRARAQKELEAREQAKRADSERRARAQQELQEKRKREQAEQARRQKEAAEERARQQAKEAEKLRLKLEATERERKALEEQRLERKRAEERRRQEQEAEERRRKEEAIQQARVEQERQQKEAEQKKKREQQKASARWVPKPETSALDGVEKPPSVAGNPIYVRPPPAPIVRATMEKIEVHKTIVKKAAPVVVAAAKPAAPAAKPVIAPATKKAAAAPAASTGGAAGKTDSKARLKLAYAVFVSGAGGLTQDAVTERLAQQGHNWTAAEMRKTLDMLVVLKLLQKDGADAWKLK